ncbi:MAG TPA: DUF1127 domain-containing protein [Bradyrhizobium sp.]|nr:DUF1127 domain-containing protein [Bradyrhizobium sp.]
MSTCTHQTMINHHEFGALGHLAKIFGLWRARWRARRELTRWTDRDLRDVGVSWSDVVREAEKPFWRA